MRDFPRAWSVPLAILLHRRNVGMGLAALRRCNASPYRYLAERELHATMMPMLALCWYHRLTDLYKTVVSTVDENGDSNIGKEIGNGRAEMRCGRHL